MGKTTRRKAYNTALSYVRKAPYPRPNIFSKPLYGNISVPWCGAFVYYVLVKGCGDTDILKGCSTPGLVSNIYYWAKARGYIKKSAQKMDLVIFDWQVNNKLDLQHVGFFIKDNGNGTITTLEGNTSNASDGNGNCVQIRIRDKKFVGCYIRLPYKIDATPEKHSYTGEALTLEGNITNIKRWQKFLNWFTGSKLTIDGKLGNNTIDTIKIFEEANSIKVTGILNENTLKKAEEYFKEVPKSSATSSTKTAYKGEYPIYTVSSNSGSKSDIKKWQKFLNWYFNYDLKEDGIFGSMTFKTTKEFQQKVKINVDGIVGPNTIASAKKVLK